MNADVKRKMVRTAQRLIFAASIAGCSNGSHEMMVAEDASSTPDAGNGLLDAATQLLDAATQLADATVRLDATAQADAALQLADGSVTADGSATDSADALVACVMQLAQTRAAYAGDGGFVEGMLPSEVVTASQPCCDTVQAYVDGSEEPFGAWPEDLRFFCCGDVGNWMSGGSCTPWGPPMPPSMPDINALFGGVLA